MCTESDSPFMEYFGRNYDNILNIAKTYKNYNEDVFHQTILNCDRVVREGGLSFATDNDALRYFLGAYKMNLLRDKMYYRNRNVEGISENVKEPSVDNGHDAITQVSIIFEEVTRIFGDQLSGIYMRYCREGVSIQRLQEEYGVRNLKQRIRDIRDYINKKYKE